MQDLGFFHVESVNPYEDNGVQAGDAPKKRTVNIKVLDFRFNNRDCNLLYMTDLTNVLQESEEKQQRKNMLNVSKWISEDL